VVIANEIANKIKVMISFCLGAAFTLVVSITRHFLGDPIDVGESIHSVHTTDPERRAFWPKRFSPHSKATTRAQKGLAKVLNRLILGLSDVQLFSSLSILIIAFVRHCQISNYHLNIVCDLAWFSCITHLVSLIVLQKYWKEQSTGLVLNIRIILMLCVVAFLTVALIWAPPHDPLAGSGGCPAQCTYDNPNGQFYFDEFLFFIQPSWIKFAGLLQTALLIYGYCTCGTFAWDQWTVEIVDEDIIGGDVCEVRVGSAVDTAGEYITVAVADGFSMMVMVPVPAGSVKTPSPVEQLHGGPAI
jgi:hypothetical protein